MFRLDQISACGDDKTITRRMWSEVVMVNEFATIYMLVIITIIII